MTLTEIPLLNDHHNHLSLYSVFHKHLNIQDVKNKNEAVSKIRKYCKDNRINVVLGWNNSRYSFEDIESFPPLIICNLSFHGFLMNRSAREMIDDSKVADNIDNKEWVEKNLPRVMRTVANVDSCTMDDIRGFLDYLLGNGIWKTEDMLATNEKIVHEVKDSDLRDRIDFWIDLDSYRKFTDKGKRHIKGIKVFTDGALGMSSAALEKNYKDGQNGNVVYTDEELAGVLEEIRDEGKPVAVHAIGDRATKQVIHILDNMDDIPDTRIEHCQFISLDVAKRAKDLGIVLSMQPNFSKDSDYYSDRLPEGYPEMNNPFRMLIDEAGFVPGEDILFGSDGMPHGINFAIEQVLSPPFMEQRLTLDELRKGYCMPDKENGYIEVDAENLKAKIICS